ncbi:Protein kinase domain-containing protein [Cinnamomum micranthum f. kanehirae]|uniref:Protein kinase domain-containing protein n=1 Tax=Cinnamomum micranthum f. kanehirae TaxID=337451 RepID=A0A3S3PEM5_9MAGN|nr:Protein kinase domain-containing protein [Cinnamomum micranthum f. kanehirae]
MKKWIRGEVIGRGSFGTVNLAIGLDEEEEPLLMAVKSAPFSHSSSIQKEIGILSQLQDCPQILRSFGHHVTTENGHLLYNIFLEYAGGGSLAHRGRLPESAIGFGDELPEIPTELSDEGKDFLSKCFVRDPSKRWTAEMLLQHPFVSKGRDDDDDDDAVNSKPSPRSALDFMAWDSMQSSMFFDSSVESRAEFGPIGVSSPADRIRNLAKATEKCPNWSNCEEDDWITIRKAEPFVSVSCSVSPRNDSFLVLEEMVQIDGKREENSDSRRPRIRAACLSPVVVQLDTSEIYFARSMEN